MNKKILIILILIAIYSYNYSFINSVYSNYNIEINRDELESNMWRDTHWITLGDSITKPNIYQTKIKDKLGFKIVDNMGISGQTMAYQENKKSTYRLGKEIDYKKYDLATIYIGTNDFRYNKKLGKISYDSCKLDENTFCGSYQLLIEYILSSNPNINLVLITPHQRVKDGYDTKYVNKEGNKLIEYVNSIKQLGHMYSLPVLDLYYQSGINEINIDKFTTDGLHLNENGYERISNNIYIFLLNKHNFCK